jgi:hypothetical protein
MREFQSDALVFFGATGDLAYKKIFPALQAMVKRGHLNVPVVGVAKAGWTLDQLKARARDSVEKHGGLDPAAFAKLSSLLRYVDGDYQNPATFAAMRKELGSAQHPAHYLAIPPAPFGVVVEQLGKSGCARGAHMEWAATSEAGRNQPFNIVNGDIFRWRWLWPRLAADFGIDAAPYPGRPTPLERQLADAGPP